MNHQVVSLICVVSEYKRLALRLGDVHGLKEEVGRRSNYYTEIFMSLVLPKVTNRQENSIVSSHLF